MGCCCEDGVKVSKMALELKSGQMLYYKRRIFGRNWSDVYAVLYNDSTLAWYRDKGQMDQEGGVYIKDSPERLAYGQFTRVIPNMPELPDNYTQNELLAVGTRGSEKVYWFLCPSEQELESWMTAISNTLPPPPKPPQQQAYPQQPPSISPVEDFPQPSAVPEMPSNLQPPTAPPPMPPQYLQQPGAMGIPGQYPTPTGFRPHPTASPLQPAYPYSNVQTARVQPAPGNTTVVVQDRRNDTGGDFAMGMLLGGALGTTVGYGWGHGYGWGWGGYGGWHSGPTVNDTDVTINNYYDVDNTYVNNDIDIDASRDMTVIADDVDFDGGDIGGDFDGGLF